VEDVYYQNISKLNSQKYNFDLDGVLSENFVKKYENGMSINKEAFVEGIIDKRIKSNSIFYLTNPSKYKNRFQTASNTYHAAKLITKIKINGGFLTSTPINSDVFALSGDYETAENLKECKFSPQSEDQFIITFFENNTCSIHQDFYGIKFNLKFYDDVGILTTLDDGDVFNYLLSDNIIFLTLTLNGDDYFVSNTQKSLKLLPLNTENKTLLINNGIEITKEIITNNEYSNNSNVCNYNLKFKTSTLEEDGSVNYLMHRTDDNLSIISLKSSITQNGTFTSNNNLLSSDSKFKSSGIRKYVSINSDISRSYDNELSLNYVHGNMEYVIKPGENLIKCPETLYPYLKLNIKDTLFIESGSFPHSTPKFADKIYKKDEITNINGQHLLCTWLSGNENSRVWVDRYYYPDLISKEQALSGSYPFQDTYKKPIEELIKSNTQLENSIIDNLFFDKVSDLCFRPSEMYIYDRFSNIDVDIDVLKPLDPCITNINYFTDINRNGKFQISFYFEDDGSNWEFHSKRNNIDGGVKISKSGDILRYEMFLYDPTTTNTHKFVYENVYKKFVKNFVAMSIDAINGVGYFYLNGFVIYKFDFDETQFVNKSIIFGDFDIIPNITNVRVDPSYIDPENLIVYQIRDSFVQIDDIIISLPCGTRNSVDNIILLQDVCGSPTFKSDTISIKIDGLDVDENLENDLKNNILNIVKKNSSITMEVEGIYINSPIDMIEDEQIDIS